MNHGTVSLCPNRFISPFSQLFSQSHLILQFALKVFWIWYIFKFVFLSNGIPAGITFAFAIYRGIIYAWKTLQPIGNFVDAFKPNRPSTFLPHEFRIIQHCLRISNYPTLHPHTFCLNLATCSSQISFNCESCETTGFWMQSASNGGEHSVVYSKNKCVPSISNAMLIFRQVIWTMHKVTCAFEPQKSLIPCTKT